MTKCCFQTKKTLYTLHGMEKYVEYIIRVEAEGINGAGLSSEPVIVRTLSDLPSRPPNNVKYVAYWYLQDTVIFLVLDVFLTHLHFYLQNVCLECF